MSSPACNYNYSSDEAVQPVLALTLLQQERERKNKIGLLQHPSLQLSIGSITQLAGPAGAGKTQLALSLCVDCVARNQRAVYIALGGPNNTASKRLRAMVAARMMGPNKTADSDTTAATATAIQALLSRIYLHWIRNSEDLMELLEHRLYDLLKRHPTISVVVLDGMSNLFRIPEEHTIRNLNDPNPWQQRATTFFQLSSRCKALSSTCQVPFLVLNGVTTRIRDDGNNHTADRSHNNLEPALGLAWNHCVNSTFFVTRTSATLAPLQPISPNTKNNNSQPQAASVSRRLLRCIKSPTVPTDTTIEFYIDHRGTIPIR